MKFRFRIRKFLTGSLKTAAMAALALLAASCGNEAVIKDRLDHLLHSHDDPAVARVGIRYLYRSDIEKMLPSELQPADSAAIAQKFITDWAAAQLIILEAGEALSEEEKDIDAEVEDFRRKLLTFRFEKLYTESHLDTVVTLDDAQKVYESHSDEFCLPYSIVRGRLAKISPKSLYYKEIKEKFTTLDTAASVQLREFCGASAEKYLDFSQEWVSAPALAKETGTDVESLEERLRGGNFFEIRNSSGNFLLFVQQRCAPGKPTPLEYNLDKIRELIISLRKQEILSTLEKNLLEEGLGSGKYKIYGQDE